MSIFFSAPDSKLIQNVKQESDLKNGDLESVLNAGSSILPFLNNGSTMLNSSMINQLQPSTPVSIFSGSPTLPSPSSPITSSSTILPNIIKPQVMGLDPEGSISSPISSNVLPSFPIGISGAQSSSITSHIDSINQPLSILTSSNQIASNILQENGLKNNVTNIQAAILAASRLMAIPAGSIPSTPLLSLANPLTTTAPSITVGNSLTTYLNPNLISELLLAGGNLKGTNLNIGGYNNTGIIHHELPENTTIYPVSDNSKNSIDSQRCISLSDTQRSNTLSSASLSSLLPNSGTTTIGSLPLSVLGVPSTLQGNNVTAPISIPPTKNVQTTHQIVKDGILPDSTIAELSAATGLPSADIEAWAAKLPSGSTVKVTRHFDTTLASMKSKIPASPTIESSTANILPIKLPNNISITATQSLIPPPPKLIAAPSKTSITSMPSLTNISIPSITSTSQQLQTNESPSTLPQYALQKGPSNGILTEYLTNYRPPLSNPSTQEQSLNLLRAPITFAHHIPSPISSFTSEASAIPSNFLSSNPSSGYPSSNESMYLQSKSPSNENNGVQLSDHHLLTSGAICLGLPSYQESFAVDPNEILSKSCHSTMVSSSITVPQTSLSTLEMNFLQRKRPHPQYSLAPNEPQPKIAELDTAYLDLNSNNSLNTTPTFPNDEVNKRIDANALLLENVGVNVFSKADTIIPAPR